MVGFTSNSLLIVLSASTYAWGLEAEQKGSREELNNYKATSLKANEESGKLFFTGPGYTVNLVNHAALIGLLGFALIYLYGDRLFGSTTADADVPGSGAPPTAYGAPEVAYGAPEAAYGAPAPSYSAPEPSYDTPSYNAANRYYNAYAANAASATK